MKIVAICLIVSCLIISCQRSIDQHEILVFTKTNGFRHESIEAGVEAILKWGDQQDYIIEHTESADYFHYENLQRFSTVIFLNTSGNVLNAEQQYQFKKYIRSGGGFVGVHGASTTEYDWPWFGDLVGGYFRNHPKIQNASIEVTNNNHLSTKHLPSKWSRTDEWYNFKYISDSINVLLTLDEASYEGGIHEDRHPIAWFHEYDGGKSFYTGLGHTIESYQEQEFLDHLFGGISYTMAQLPLPAYTPSQYSMPDENRFTRTILAQNLDEPMEMDIFSDGRILVVERKGGIKLYDPKVDLLFTITKFPVHTKFEDGLLGLAIDPDYENNNFIYLCYSPVGERPVQHVSRFLFQENQLDLNSERVVIEIPVQRDECCHSGGALEFGPDGLLYIGVGDDTNPFASDGFAPIDDRLGRKPWDAQRSSGNTNDLRGKILRIKVNDDGTYDIPDGNLFQVGIPNTKPEIYTMGLRNPFRFDIDNKRNWLFWGDVGPDAGKDGEMRGPKGFDGVNLAKGPGNWGWPFARGNRTPYYDYDFDTKESGELFDPDHLINNSANNTGLTNLPPMQGYLIWYSYDESEDFPWVRTGGKNPMAGPTYYSSDFPKAKSKFPPFFEGKIFIYEWMRDWIFVLEVDKQGEYVKVDQFLPNSEFHNPMDMLFGPDGSLYILEYGEKWFAQNLEARINKIEFHDNNQAPVARIMADINVGKSPASINFSGQESMDFDGDKLSYAWSFDSDEIQSREANPTHIFKIPGAYQVQLTVADNHGNKSTTKYPVLIGNDPPKVSIELDDPGNPYFWYGRELFYQIKVYDAEDGAVSSLNPEKIKASIQYLAEGQDLTMMAQGHLEHVNAAKVASGKQLIDGSDCKSCHHNIEKINGPSYFEISKKYTASDKDYLIQKIIKGGNGVWGKTVMSAHPQLKEQDVNTMVDWILSLENITVSAERSLPIQGNYTLTDHDMSAKKGSYVVMASYQDAGAYGLPPSTGRDQIQLVYPIFKVNDLTNISDNSTIEIQNGVSFLKVKHSSKFSLPNVYLTQTKYIKLNHYFPNKAVYEGLVEVRINNSNGPIIGSSFYKNVNSEEFLELKIPIKPHKGDYQLFFIYSNEKIPDKDLALLTSIELGYE